MTNALCTGPTDIFRPRATPFAVARIDDHVFHHRRTFMSATTHSGRTADSDYRPREAGADLADKAADLAAKAGATVEDAMQGAERAAHKIHEQGREAGERVNEVAGNLKTAVDKSVREQPLTTLVVAAAAGFVLGALWKS
jgi:ElaB/YqjD/DUF883 family membrane-anchored ribosome-binding protein